MLRQINDFFETTTIHGFVYISNSQLKSTRIVWAVAVLIAFGGASYFLYETIDGFSDKYVSTTIETRSIQEFPFPAVTIHPGDYNSENYFLRNFLNQFEFTRYDKNSSLKDNVEFNKVYRWLVSPMNDQLFDSVEKYLIESKSVDSRGRTFLQAKGGIFRKEVCSLVALRDRNISLQETIRRTFLFNLYKFRYFPYLLKVIRKLISPVIEDTFDLT